MHDISLITTIAAAFTGAWLLGLLTQRLGLSPIVGYLLAGVAIGPHTPGFVGDLHLAAQLAEIGVILLMFGVGLHFHLEDLLAVKWVAIPGALAQSAVATGLGVLVGSWMGWSLQGGLLLGMALAVASTVVLLRVLMDNNLLESIHGHVAVGWLIVEDVLTVAVLVILPALAGTAVAADAAHAASTHAATGGSFWMTLAVALLKLAVLVVVLLKLGSRLIPWILSKVAALHSRELFTLTVLVLAIAVATASAVFFGASMALGAFLAGMAVAASPLSQQAAADALPLRDAFAVLFFASVGMLFDPMFLLHEPVLVLLALSIVLIAKPLTAMLVVSLLGYSARTALIVALGLAQIGEFSFILGELGRSYGLLPAAGHSVLVACALVSITLNPLLFRALDRIEAALKTRPALWRLLNARSEKSRRQVNAEAAQDIAADPSPLAVIVGFGPVGQTVDRLLRQSGLKTVIVDMNVDTVHALAQEGRSALYGDASHADILREAGLLKATHLVVTLPHSQNRGPLLSQARRLNPSLKILVRARYLREREDLEQLGATEACFEEAEAAVALGKMVLRDLGREATEVRQEGERIREQFLQRTA